MKFVSDRYKEVMNETIRPTSQFQASLEMIDRSVESDATVIASEEMPFSSGVFDKVHECDYITFEGDFFRVGSNLRIVPEENFLKNGYVSSAICNEIGDFIGIDRPVIEFNFRTSRNFIAMSYEFAYAYPRDIYVTYYLDGVMQGNFISHPTGLSYTDTENHIYECDRIIFNFNHMSTPNCRLRLSRLVFGYEKKFEMSDIISVDHTLSVDPISSSLPYEKLSLKVNNLSKDYNPDNPRGIWEYFSNGQPFSIRYGVEIDKRIEWVEAGRLVLSDAPTVDSSTATFEAVDILSTLTNVYNKGVWCAEGKTLYDLAVDVFEDAGITNYSLSESLKNIKTTAPSPVVPHRECLQLIANAGACVLYTDSHGTITLEEQTYKDVPEDFYLDFTKLFDKPVVKKTEKLKSVDVSAHSLYKDITPTELCKYEAVEINGITEIQVEYDMATDFETIVEGGELLSATYYAETAFLQISAESPVVNIIVHGYKIIDDVSVVSTRVNDSGEVCPLNNPLVTDIDRAKVLGVWVSTYLKARNTYEANFRQDFSLDINDVILIRSDFEENIPARITKLQYRLPGQQGAISVRRVT